LGSGYGKLAYFVRVAVLAALTAGLAADNTPSKKEVLKRAAAYVDQQAELLPQLVAEERSSQTLRPRVRRSTASPPRVIQARADFAWLRLEGMPEAIGVRDVREVDGRPVGGAERLEELLRRPTTSSIAAARALLAESARYNVGPLWRNVNLPTTALFLLHDSLQPRFSWKVEGTEASGAVVLFFKERERPTVIRGLNGEPVFSRGRIWIDPATGTVQRTELHTEARDPEGDKTYYQLLVEFAVDESLQVLLPRRLREHYETRTEVVDGKAEYVNYRRFQTGGRLVR
jgi:hypothetical protein